jgi:hypothetical protein
MAIPRVLVASGSVEGVDHERLASNELMHEFIQYKVFLSNEDVPSNFATWIKGWGGECRLEFRMTASIVANRGIQVSINGKLFEGDSEATSDLAEEKTEVVLVPKGTSTIHRMNLYNSGALGGGGDSGSITLTLMNRPAEDEEIEQAGQAEPPPIRFQMRPFRDVIFRKVMR